MDTTLNKDVLKRTAGLLAQIDIVTSADSVAERVSRVIESAAPAVLNMQFHSVEAWLAYDRDEDTGEFADDITHHDCGCSSVEVERRSGDDIWTDDVPDHFTDEYGRLIQSERIDPFDEIGILIIASHAGARAADIPCGAEGCACHEMFEAQTLCDFCERPVRIDTTIDGPDEDEPYDVWVTGTGGDYCHARAEQNGSEDGFWSEIIHIHTPKEVPDGDSMG